MSILRRVAAGSISPRGNDMLSVRLALVAAPLLLGSLQGQQAPGVLPIIGVGDSRVDGRLIHPGSTTKRMILTGMGPPRDAGTLTQVIELTRLDGHPAMLSVQSFAGGVVDSSFFDLQTLRPIRQRSHNPARVMSLDFSGTNVSIHLAPVGKPDTARTQHLERPTFDSNVAELVFAALPLAPGFAARIPVYTYESGGLVWYQVRVTGTDSLPGALGAKTVTWAVELQAPERKIRYWITKDSRRVVKSAFDLGGQRVLTITAL